MILFNYHRIMKQIIVKVNNAQTSTIYRIARKKIIDNYLQPRRTFDLEYLMSN